MTRLVLAEYQFHWLSNLMPSWVWNLNLMGQDHAQIDKRRLVLQLEMRQCAFIISTVSGTRRHDNCCIWQNLRSGLKVEIEGGNLRMTLMKSPDSWGLWEKFFIRCPCLDGLVLFSLQSWYGGKIPISNPRARPILLALEGCADSSWPCLPSAPRGMRHRREIMCCRFLNTYRVNTMIVEHSTWKRKRNNPTPKLKKSRGKRNHVQCE